MNSGPRWWVCMLGPLRNKEIKGSDIYSREPSGFCAGPVAIITHHILILAPMESNAFDYS